MVEFVSRKDWGLNRAVVAATPRTTYAQRADALIDMIHRIAQSNHDPHAFHEARDLAERTARQLSLSLAADGL